jgi:Cyclophilin-like family
VGDIAYYAPWGNLAIFYKDFGYSRGLIGLGRIDSGIEALNVPGSLTVTIERVGKWATGDEAVFKADGTGGWPGGATIHWLRMRAYVIVDKEVTGSAGFEEYLRAASRDTATRSSYAAVIER